jgi:hypothetical protein
MFGRQFFWSLRATDEFGDTLVPETMGVKVDSLSAESAFQGLRIRICCGKTDAQNWKHSILEARVIYLKRYDACGNVAEHWKLIVTDMFEVRLEEWITKEMDEDPDCPFGDFLHFAVKCGFNLLPLPDGRDAYGGRCNG